MGNPSVARLNNYKQPKKFGDTFFPGIAQVSLRGGPEPASLSVPKTSSDGGWARIA
jgi:hypothetical protein